MALRCSTALFAISLIALAVPGNALGQSVGGAGGQGTSGSPGSGGNPGSSGGSGSGGSGGGGGGGGGGIGGSGAIIAGGAGGGNGTATNGGDGGNGNPGGGFGLSGSGGGGGGHGLVTIGTTLSNGFSGGRGGAGGIAVNAGGGGGGGGGNGVVQTGSGSIVVDLATGRIAGGAGGDIPNVIASAGQTAAAGNAGAGGVGISLATNATLSIARGVIEGGAGGSQVPNASSGTIIGGNGGGGGTGVRAGWGSTIVNAGTILGGSGGAGGAGINGGSDGRAGEAGAGIVGSGLSITNSGAISGGRNVDGTLADAIRFEGGNNRLTITASSQIEGIVRAHSASDVLTLGGSHNGSVSFDLARLGAAMSTSSQYLGFGTLSKSGEGTWIVTGSQDGIIDLEINRGTLDVRDPITVGVVKLQGGTLAGNGVTGSAVELFSGTIASSSLATQNIFTAERARSVTITGAVDAAVTASLSGGETVLSSGGSLSAGNAVLDGSVRVDGPSSILIGRDVFYVGESQQGILHLTNGGTARAGAVRQAQAFRIGSEFGGRGLVVIGAFEDTPPVAAGTILADRIIFAAGDQPDSNRLVFNHSGMPDGGPLNFRPVIESAHGATNGGFIQHLGGETIFSGRAAEGEYFRGQIEVTGGRLILDGIVGDVNPGPDQPWAKVTVGSNGVLGQNGIFGGSGRLLGNLDVLPGGIVAPGTKIGTLSVLGDVHFQSGSRFDVEISSGLDMMAPNDGGAPRSVSDRLSVSGTAYLGDAAVQVLTIDPHTNYANNQRYRILEAEGGIRENSRFSGVAIDSMFITPTLQYDTRGVMLVLGIEPPVVNPPVVNPPVVNPPVVNPPVAPPTQPTVVISGSATTSNQVNVAKTFDWTLEKANINFVPIEFLPVVNHVLMSSNQQQLNSRLDLLSGEIHASGAHNYISTNTIVTDVMIDNFVEIAELPGDDGVLSAVDTGVEEIGGDPLGSRVWTDIYGARISNTGNANAAATEGQSGGIIAGIDGIASDWRLGAMISVGGTGFDVPARASTARSSDFGAGFYAGTAIGNTNLRFGATAVRHDVETTRTVGIPGAASTLSANYGALTSRVFAEIGHEFDFGTATLEPFARLGVIHHRRDGFTETGGPAALNSGALDVTGIEGVFGVRGEIEFALENDMVVSLDGSVAYRHGLEGDSGTINAFAAGPSFAVAGTRTDSSALVLDAGAELRIDENFSLNASYTGAIGGFGDSHVVRAGLSYRF